MGNQFDYSREDHEDDDDENKDKMEKSNSWLRAHMIISMLDRSRKWFLAKVRMSFEFWHKN